MMALVELSHEALDQKAISIMNLGRDIVIYSNPLGQGQWESV